MSVISSALDQTKLGLHRKQKSRVSELDPNGRVDTDGNDPDCDVLDKLMADRNNNPNSQGQFKSVHSNQKQAIGTSMDIFDSSYGSMPYRGF